MNFLVLFSFVASLPFNNIQSGGSLTFYDPSTGGGACDGIVHKRDDLVVAMPPNTKRCGSFIKIFYRDRSVVAKIVDQCPGCWETGIDGTLGVWAALGISEGSANQIGRLDVEWVYV